MKVFGEIPDLSDALLVVGVPSKGNVGQLALDAMLATLLAGGHAKRIAILESPYLATLAGYECYNPSEPPILCLPLELYSTASPTLFLLLQRSVCISGNSQRFAEELVACLASTFRCRWSVVLTGAGLPDSDLEVQRSLFSLSSSAASSLLRSSSISSLLAVIPHFVWQPSRRDVFDFDALKSGLSIEDHGEGEAAQLEGMTMGKALLTAGERASDLEMVVLGLLCVECDNRPDGVRLAKLMLQQLLSNKDGGEVDWVIREPSSWRHLFGPGIGGYANLY